MRAAEVQLHAIAIGRLDALEDRLPACLLARHHQRDDQRAVGPVALDLLDLVEIDLQWPVGDQLDVGEAHHAQATDLERAVARGGVDDRRSILAQGLPHRAAPACLEGAHDVVGLVGRRRGGKPERVGRLDAGEARAEVSHGQFPSDLPGRRPLRSSLRDLAGTRIFSRQSTTVHPRWTGPMPMEWAFLPSQSAFPGLPLEKNRRRRSCRFS